MNPCKRWTTLLVLISAPLVAQTASGGKTSTTAASKRRSTAVRTAAAPGATAATAEDIRSLREMLTRQQQQIQELQRQLQRRDQAVQQQAVDAQRAQSAASEAQAKATEVADAAKTVNTDVADLKANATTAALALQDEQKRVTEMVESPLSIHYKGVTITPGGFLAAETVWRAHAMASDVNTPFNSVPFSGFGAQHLSEFFGTGRTSRITLLVEGKLDRFKLTGYYEADWLSAGVTSNNNQSNSYTNRQRQMWGQAALTNGWSFTGGHMWSLVTETKNGMDNRTEAVPSVIDHAYNVGFSWARQYGFRVTKNFNNKVWLGFSIENAQTLMTAQGNLNNFTFGNAGTGGGAFNPTANYSFNVSPDYVVKAVWQPKYGHYEVIGLLSPLRDRVYPNATATPASSAGAFNDTRIGGGVGVNARWLFYQKHIEFGVHGMGGDGIGRYGASGLPDATVRPDGTLALLHSYQGLGTLEFHYPKYDVYFNGGTEYVTRYAQLRPGPPPVAVGYGSTLFNNSGCLTEAVPAGGNGFVPGTPGNCRADTRNLFEFSAGFYIKFYNGPKGRVQWGPQYSYIRKNTWAGVGGSPNADEHMLLTSFRYYLP